MRFQSITVYKSYGDGWLKSVYDKAFIRLLDGLGFDRSGQYKQAKMTARIFSPSAKSVCIGDFVELGTGGSEPSEDALVVTEISDNLDFSLPHIRISAT